MTVEDVIRGLEDREIVGVLAAGIDKALGSGSYALILRTMKLAYDFNVTPKSIKTRKFDVLLVRLIGEIGYDHVVHSIIKERDANRGKDTTS